MAVRRDGKLRVRERGGSPSRSVRVRILFLDAEMAGAKGLRRTLYRVRGRPAGHALCPVRTYCLGTRWVHMAVGGRGGGGVLGVGACVRVLRVLVWQPWLLREAGGQAGVHTRSGALATLI